MKEKEVINQLRLLQSVQPKRSILLNIRRDVRTQDTRENKILFKNNLRVIPLLSTLVFASIVIIIFMILFFPDYLESTLTNAKIALATNHYDKAKIALKKVDEELPLLQKNNSETKIISFSHTLAMANTQLSELHLVGEKEKYTSYQCLELYESYHKDLEKIQSTVNQNNNSNETLLLGQAKEYDTSAIAKLNKYHRETDMGKENQ